MAVLSTGLPHKVVLAASFLALLEYVRGRYVFPGSSSKFVAICHLGPFTSMRSIGWMAALFGRFAQGFPKNMKKLGEQRVEAYKSQRRASDVVVDVPAKSGTTWLMQICHQLRMRGEEHVYDDQMEVMPWLEGGPALVLEDDVNKPQPASPRVFKSHMTWKELERKSLAKDTKVVYCFRDFKDKVYSAWRFMTPMVEYDVPFWAFSTGFVLGDCDSALNDLCDFWQHRKDDNVCFFFFDDLKERHHECVVRVKAFMDIQGGPELVDKVVAQSTHAYMSRPDQATKFDDHQIVYTVDRNRGITRTVPLTGKVRKDGGASGSGKEKLADHIKEWIDWRWRCIVLPRTGFADLKAMRTAWAQECRAMH